MFITSNGARSHLIVVKVVLVVALLIGAPLAAIASGDAEDGGEFPTRTIEVIVPWGAGGSTDVLARALAPYLEEYLGESITVVNKPGANGTIATSEFKNTRADGHTVLFNAVGNFTIQPFLRELNYDLDDFKGVIGLTTEPIIIGANADSGYESLEDLVADYQSTGAELNYGASAVGALPHLSQAAFFMEAGIGAAVVPHDGGGPAVTALLGGHVDTAAAHPGEIMPQVDAGEITALGVFSGERIDSAPDVPTVQEQGYDVGVFEVWKFVLVPGDTPDAVVQALHDGFESAFNDPDFQQEAERLRLNINAISGAEVMERLAEQQGSFQPVVESLDLQS